VISDISKEKLEKKLKKHLKKKLKKKEKKSKHQDEKSTLQEEEKHASFQLVDESSDEKERANTVT
jgi:hypothetical protein